ncbi:hypothetical protein SNEBB_003120 [Seison nebaliae]|nr:hypothetical protein SNEBB_003120 [Seison nebaliae]
MTDRTKLIDAVLTLVLTEKDIHLFTIDQLINDIPKKWKCRGDSIELKENDFQLEIWRKFKENKLLYSTICDVMKKNRILIYRGVKNDKYRSPDVHQVYGDKNEWIITKENNVIFTFNFNRSMFCMGNGSEKSRLIKLMKNDDIVLDMFAGIGYFTLPILVHTNVRRVYACEWNPFACEALDRALSLNRIDKNRCIINNGDCRNVGPKNVASHCLLGLIPSSSIAYSPAIDALDMRREECYLHVHTNVDLVPKTRTSPVVTVNGIYREKSEEIMYELNKFTTVWMITISNIVKIKSYAPNIHHIVIDYRFKRKYI